MDAQCRTRVDQAPAHRPPHAAQPDKTNRCLAHALLPALPKRYRSSTIVEDDPLDQMTRRGTANLAITEITMPLQRRALDQATLLVWPSARASSTTCKPAGVLRDGNMFFRRSSCTGMTRL